MSQITHPPMQLSAQLRAHRLVALAALLALLGAAAVALVLAIGNESSTTSVADRPLPTARADGGPEESAVAAEVASRGPTPGPLAARSAPATFAPSAITSMARPDESVVAAAVGTQPSAVRPDESAVAAAIGTQPSAVRPDESAVAAAIGSASTPESPSGPGFNTD